MEEHIDASVKLVKRYTDGSASWMCVSRLNKSVRIEYGTNGDQHPYYQKTESGNTLARAAEIMDINVRYAISDGWVCEDPEHVFKFEHEKHVVEIFVHLIDELLDRGIREDEHLACFGELLTNCTEHRLTRDDMHNALELIMCRHSEFVEQLEAVCVNCIKECVKDYERRCTH